jgi:DNA-binding MurR/RpiR family transcriptional regulator
MQPADDLDVTTDVRRWLDLLFQQHRLSPAHRRIARFLVEHPDEAVYLSSGELAQRAQVSQPSVTRFATTLGFGGYPELRGELRSRVLGEMTSAPAQDARDAWHRAIAADVLNLQQLTSSPWAGERLDRVAANLVTSRPLPVVGLRVSRPLAELFAYFARKVHPDVRDPRGTTHWPGPVRLEPPGCWPLGCPDIPANCLARCSGPAGSGCGSRC